MILINLLPHREVARQQRKEFFQFTMFLSALVGVLLAGLVYAFMQVRIDTQYERNAFLSSEIEGLDKKIKEVAGLESEIKALGERQKAVEALQANRNMPVYLLNDLVSVLPEGVYISSIKQNGLLVELKGVAQSNERVSEVLRNFSSKTSWFKKPDLKEIVSGTVDVSHKDQRKVVEFIMYFTLILPEESMENRLDEKVSS